MEKNKKKKYEKPSMKVVKLAQKRQALLNNTKTPYGDPQNPFGS